MNRGVKISMKKPNWECPYGHQNFDAYGNNFLNVADDKLVLHFNYK